MRKNKRQKQMKQRRYELLQKEGMFWSHSVGEPTDCTCMRTVNRVTPESKMYTHVSLLYNMSCQFSVKKQHSAMRRILVNKLL